MSDITVPTAGTPILDTWGADVAERLNQLVPLIIESDTATDTAEGAPGGATLFEVECVSGQQYNIDVAGTYEVSATNQGLRLYVDESLSVAGTVSGFAQIVSTSATAITNANLTASTWLGTTSTLTAAVARYFRFHVIYDCSSSGTLTLKFARGGTSGSTGVTVHAGTGGLVVVSPA